eukprot:scaffold43121_cov54-Phaeocystis_antarctica.AAC.3
MAMPLEGATVRLSFVKRVPPPSSTSDRYLRGRVRVRVRVRLRVRVRVRVRARVRVRVRILLTYYPQTNVPGRGGRGSTGHEY